VKSLEHALVRNAVFGGGGRLLTLAVGLVITPYLLHHLGPDRFGVWALVAVVTGLAGLLDPSLRSALIKHLAETDARGDRAGRDAVVTTALLFYLPLASVVLAGFFPLREPVLRLLRLPHELQAEAGDAFFIGLVGLALSWVLGIFPAIVDARQRMDLTNGLGVVCLVLTAALTIAAVENGLGVRGVAGAQVVGITIFHLGSVALAWRVAGPLRLYFKADDRRWYRRIFRFGLTLHVSSACAVVNRQLDKLLLSRFAGLPTVASYEIGLRVVANAGSFQPFLTSALLPAASHLQATGDITRLRELYLRSSRYLFTVGLPPFVLASVFAGDVITAWIGRPDPFAAAVLMLLTGGYLVNSSSNAMAFVCQGIGRPDIQARQSALQLVANILLSVVLLWWIGPLGAPLGTSLALLIGAVFFAVRFHPVIGTTTTALLRRAALAPAVAAGVAAGAAWIASSGMAAGGRAEALFKLLVGSAAFSAVYLGLCLAAGVVDRQDLRSLASAIRRPHRGAIE
jgi:O-antigen/teichoic acid export membrane protein